MPDHFKTVTAKSQGVVCLHAGNGGVGRNPGTIVLHAADKGLRPRLFIRTIKLAGIHPKARERPVTIIKARVGAAVGIVYPSVVAIQNAESLRGFIVRDKQQGMMVRVQGKARAVGVIGRIFTSIVIVRIGNISQCA